MINHTLSDESEVWVILEGIQKYTNNQDDIDKFSLQQSSNARRLQTT